MTRIVDPPANLHPDADASSSTAPRDDTRPPLDGALTLSGSPESVIAAALVALEDTEQRQEIMRSDAFQQRLEQRLAAIDDGHRENQLTLAAGLLSGFAQIAKGTSALVGAGTSTEGDAQGDGTASDRGSSKALVRANASLQALQMAAAPSSTVLGFEAKTAALDGQRHELEAEASEDAAKRATRARDEADESADRMLDGIQELGRLRHEAALAALRG